MSGQSSSLLPDKILGLPADEIAALLGYREQQEVDAEDAPGDPGAGLLSTDPSPQAMQAAAHVSPGAFDLIVSYETGGRPYYEHVSNARPIWPQASSGVTIGFGYDLGYVTDLEFKRDWTALLSGLSASQRAALAACVGVHGGTAPAQTMQALAAGVGDVAVSWEAALSVYRSSTLPRFALRTLNALPNCDALSNDCFGVLVSLTFNRGASYAKAQDPGDTLDRYREMRAIKAAMQARRFGDVAALIEAMIRIWVGTSVEDGMRRRRTEEAAMFLEGLAACTPDPAVLALQAGETPPAPPGAPSVHSAGNEGRT